MTLLKRFWVFCAVFFQKNGAQTLKEQKKPRKIADLNRGKDIEKMGKWYFKKGLLDRLDEYFFYIRRMKKTDKQGYKMIRRVGAIITAEKLEVRQKQFPASWRAGKRTGFGAIAFLYEDSDKDNMVPLRFIYYNKLRRVPPTVEPSNGTVYHIVMFHGKKEESGWQISDDFHVAVKGNDVVPLMQLCSETQDVKTKKTKGRKKNSYGFHIERQVWQYPRGLQVCYETCLEKEREEGKYRPETIQEYGGNLFRILVNMYEHANSDIRIRCQKNSICASFTIDLLRTPYFFSDREPVIIDGVKKKIFHIVRTHSRKLAGGRETNVKSHFRGLRRFLWNSYDINITMPGFHHKDVTEFDLASDSYSSDEIFPSEEYVGTGKVGKMLDNYMNV